jgi:hypothetical protein
LPEGVCLAQGLETKPDSQELKAEAAACEEVKEALTEASATLAAQNWGEAKQLFDRLGDKMLASLVCKLGLAAAELGLNNPAQALRNTLAVRECLFRSPRRARESLERRVATNLSVCS